mmetsp:Transcript_134129/g.244672  ORF Transcript_134129/g.244672 Transcript_134129/m.244672 type:complete len:178 (-) Transcript_134129:71-604(-)
MRQRGEAAVPEMSLDLDGVADPSRRAAAFALLAIATQLPLGRAWAEAPPAVAFKLEDGLRLAKSELRRAEAWTVRGQLEQVQTILRQPVFTDLFGFRPGNTPKPSETLVKSGVVYEEFLEGVPPLLVKIDGFCVIHRQGITDPKLDLREAVQDLPILQKYLNTTIFLLDAGLEALQS